MHTSRLLVLMLAFVGCKERCWIEPCFSGCDAKNASKSICSTRHSPDGDVTTCVYECHRPGYYEHSEPEDAR